MRILLVFALLPVLASIQPQQAAASSSSSAAALDASNDSNSSIARLNQRLDTALLVTRQEKPADYQEKRRLEYLIDKLELLKQRINDYEYLKLNDFRIFENIFFELQHPHEHARITALLDKAATLPPPDEHTPAAVAQLQQAADFADKQIALTHAIAQGTLELDALEQALNQHLLVEPHNPADKKPDSSAGTVLGMAAPLLVSTTSGIATNRIMRTKHKQTLCQRQQARSERRKALIGADLRHQV
jgi:hypothetical protein